MDGFHAPHPIRSNAHAGTVADGRWAGEGFRRDGTESAEPHNHKMRGARSLWGCSIVSRLVHSSLLCIDGGAERNRTGAAVHRDQSRYRHRLMRPQVFAYSCTRPLSSADVPEIRDNFMGKRVSRSAIARCVYTYVIQVSPISYTVLR